MTNLIKGGDIMYTFHLKNANFSPEAFDENGNLTINIDLLMTKKAVEELIKTDGNYVIQKMKVAHLDQTSGLVKVKPIV